MTRLFRLFLRLYPHSVRQRLGEAMIETFEEEWTAVRAQGMGPSALFALRTIARTPLLALEERARGLRLPPVRWWESPAMDRAFATA